MKCASWKRKVYEETKGMTTDELLARHHSSLERADEEIGADVIYPPGASMRFVKRNK